MRSIFDVVIHCMTLCVKHSEHSLAVSRKFLLLLNSHNSLVVITHFSYEEMEFRQLSQLAPCDPPRTQQGKDSSPGVAGSPVWALNEPMVTFTPTCSRGNQTG